MVSVGDGDDEDESWEDCDRGADTVGGDECDVVIEESPDDDAGAVNELLRVIRVEALAVRDACVDSLGSGDAELVSVALRDACDGVPAAEAQLDDDIRPVGESPPDAVTCVEADCCAVGGAEYDPAGDAVDEDVKNVPVASAEALTVEVSCPLEVRTGESLAYFDIICDIDGIVETRADKEKNAELLSDGESDSTAVEVCERDSRADAVADFDCDDDRLDEALLLELNVALGD